MKRYLALMTGVAVALAGAQSASAQSSTTEELSELKLEEVVVTAERVRKDLQKVSQVINVKSGEELKKEGKTRIDEILQGLPGIQLQSDQVDTSIYMRGISSGVPLLIDGVSVGGGAAARGTSLDIAQVAIARGVQKGAGVTSLTGSVSLTTNKPVFEYQASGSMTIGSYNLRNTEGVLNLPLSENQAVRLAYSADRRNGYMKNDAGNSDNRQFRLRYRWQASDNLDITASFQENNTNGNGVSNGVLLYTGHWIDWTAGQTLNWTNPYTGVSSTWTANQIQQSGFVNAANATATPGTTTALAAAGLSSATQYLYSAGPCSASTLTNSTTTATATSTTSVATLGPIITTMGCPYRQIAIRDGVNFYDRSNPWDDGFKPNAWPNSPVRNTVQRTANVQIDWQTSYGKWSIQPAYVYNLNQFVEPARGTSWREQGFIPTTSERLDVQLSSNQDSKLTWVAGLNGSYAPRPEKGITAVTYSMPTAGWTTGTAATGPGGMATTASVATSCYTVIPGSSSTASGTSNSNQCEIANYTATGVSYSLAASIQANYSLLDNLRLNSSLRRDWYATESFGTMFDTLIDGTGQRYVWYLPSTTYATSTTTNPNGLFVVPARMNISQADIDAVVDSVHTWRKSKTASYTLNVEYDVLDNAMLYAKYATGSTQAMAAGMGGATGGSINVTLPNALIPGTTNNYVTSVNLPAPSVKGEITDQISLGLKSRWLDNSLQANVEVFYNQYHNRSLSQMLSSLYGWTSDGMGGGQSTIQCTASATTPIAVTLGSATTGTDSCFAVNTASYTGDMLSKGVDLDVSWVPSANDRIDMQVEYLRMTFAGVPAIGTLTADAVLALNTGTTANTTVAQMFADGYNSFLDGIKGQTLQQAPRWSVTSNYQHQFDLSNGGRLTPKVTGYYKSAFYFTEQTQNGSNSNILNSNWAINNHRDLPSVQKGYTMWDAYLQWQPQDGKWNLNGYVKNLTNKAIMASNSATGITSGAIATNDLSMLVTGGYVTLNAPRTFGLTLTANF